ncbi:MAG: hypothetical protein ACKO0X_10250, partial [Bacteroidota bacterium]
RATERRPPPTPVVSQSSPARRRGLRHGPKERQLQPSGSQWRAGTHPEHPDQNLDRSAAAEENGGGGARRERAPV